MSVILWPADMPVRRQLVTLERLSQTQRSPWTFARQVQDYPGAALWRLECEIVPMLEARALPVRAWLSAMRGAVNQCRVPVYESAGVSSALSITVQGGGQAGGSLLTAGWPVNSTALGAGRHITVGDQLLRLTAPVVSNGTGLATLSFEPWLRVSPASGAAVEVRYPWLLASLADDEQDKYEVTAGGLYQFAFRMEEAFPQ
jgi:hypothetical protein